MCCLLCYVILLLYLVLTQPASTIHSISFWSLIWKCVRWNSSMLGLASAPIDRAFMVSMHVRATVDCSCVGEECFWCVAMRTFVFEIHTPKLQNSLSCQLDKVEFFFVLQLWFLLLLSRFLCVSLIHNHMNCFFFFL